MNQESTDQLSDQLSDLFAEQVSVDIVRQDSQTGARLTVCRMNYTKTDANSDSSRASRTVNQTAVVFDADDLDVPQFLLAPHMKGLVGKVFAKLGNIGDVNFEDSPEFSDAYFLHAWKVEAVRILFTRDVRDYFTINEGWSVRGKGAQLVISKHNQIIPDDQMGEFIQDALRILELLRQGERELDARPEVGRETTPEDMIATAQGMGGIAGGLLGSMLESALRKIAVTDEELDKFLTAPVPRKIPPGMKRQVLGDNVPLMVAGVVMMLAGTTGGVLTMIFAEGKAKWIGASLLFIPVVGFLMTFLTYRFRRNWARCLSSGKLAKGRVADVERTSTVVNNQRRHIATIEFSLDGTEQTQTTNIYNTAVEKARKLKESQQEVTVLVDPLDNSRIHCPDFLVMFEG